MALLKCTDSSEYKVLSCLNAKLIEVNERIINHPELLALEGDGYVAIGLPKMENIETIKEKLMTEKQYQELCEETKSETTENTE